MSRNETARCYISRPFHDCPRRMHGGYELAGRLHILCAFWGFVLMSLHLGVHWCLLLAMARRHLRSNRLRTWALRISGYGFAAYGAVAFVRRDVGLYLLLKSHSVFFDYTEPLIIFLSDYLAVMALFTAVGFWLDRSFRLIFKDC